MAATTGPSAASGPEETACTTTPAGWFADPLGRHQLRYFDGTQWTEHVSSNGRTAVDPPVGQGHVPTVQRAPERVQGDVTRAGKAGVAAYQGGGTIFTESVLVVNQKAKLIEINNEYAIFDQNARQLAAVREVGQSSIKKAARFLTSLDQYMTHQLQIVDMSGNVLLGLTRPAKFVKSKIIVTDPGGNELGQIVQQNAIGKIRFGLESGGHSYGMIQGENWRAWNFASATTPAPRSPASPRRGRAWRRRCSPRPTTTWCRSTASSRIRCGCWSSPRRSASTPR